MLAEVEAWTRSQLDPATLAELRALPEHIELELGGTRVLCVHGSPRDFNDQLLVSTSDAQLIEWTAGYEFDVLVCGHTHVQLLRRIDAQVFVNVGSLGMPFARPFAGDTPEVLPWAEYAILSVTPGASLAVELRCTHYDVAAFAADLEAAGFPHADHWLDNWRLSPS